MSLASRISAALDAFRGKTKRPDYAEQDLNALFALPPVDLEFPKVRRLVTAVATSCELVSNAIAQLPVRFEQGSGDNWKPIERAPGNITDVWLSANFIDTSFELRRDISENLLNQGNAYLFLDYAKLSKVQMLWCLNAHRVTPKVGKGRAVEFYEYDRGGVRERIEPDRIIHLRYHNSEDKPVGLSPLESVQLQYETSYDLMRLLQRVVRNGGRTSGHYKVADATAMLSEADYEALRKRIERNVYGIDNATRPKILDVLEWVQSGMTIQELQFIENSALTESKVYARFFIPPSFVGLPDPGAKGGLNGTGTNAGERMFWEARKAEAALFDSVMNERFCPLFGANIRMRTDFSSVIALQEPLLQQAQALVTLVGRPLLSVNDALEMLGKPKRPEPEFDELYVKPDPLSALGADPNAQDVGPGKPEPAANEKKSRAVESTVHRERLKARAAADLRRQEKRVAAEFRAIFEYQRKRIHARIDEDGIRARGLRAMSIDELLAPDPEDEAEVQRLFEKFVEDRMGSAAVDLNALTNLATDFEINLQSLRVHDFLRSQAASVTRTTSKTTADELRAALSALAQGELANASLAEQVAAVRAAIDEVFAGRKNDALTIARTETTRAYNFATREAWTQSEVVEAQEWLTAGDSAVRETHAEVDGDIVPLGGSFRVGGDELEYPGDPSGSAEETINCRCTLLPVVNERALKAKQWDAWYRKHAPGTNGHANGHAPANRIAALLTPELRADLIVKLDGGRR